MRTGARARQYAKQQLPHYLEQTVKRLKGELESVEGAFDSTSEKSKESAAQMRRELQRLDLLSTGAEMNEAWKSLRSAARAEFEDVAREVVQTCLDAKLRLDPSEQVTASEIRKKASEAASLAKQLAKRMQYPHLRDLRLFDLLPQEVQERLTAVDALSLISSTVPRNTTPKLLNRRAAIVRKVQLREHAIAETLDELPLDRILALLADACAGIDNEPVIDLPRTQNAASRRLIHELSLLMHDRLNRPLHGFVARAAARLYQDTSINEEAVRAHTKRHPDEFRQKIRSFVRDKR